MSKSDKEPKTPKYRQGNLFSDQGGATSKEAGGTSRGARRAELLSRLEEQRTLTTGIVDKLTRDCVPWPRSNAVNR